MHIRLEIEDDFDLAREMRKEGVEHLFSPEGIDTIYRRILSEEAETGKDIAVDVNKIAKLYDEYEDDLEAIRHLGYNSRRELFDKHVVVDYTVSNSVIVSKG